MVAKPGLVGSSAKLYLYSNNLNSILILYLHLHFYSNDTCGQLLYCCFLTVSAMGFQTAVIREGGVVFELTPYYRC